MKKKELLKYLPGFRSNNKYKKIISIVGHIILLLFTLLMILSVTVDGITKQDKIISLISDIIMYLCFIVIPYIVIANPFYLKKYMPIFNMKNKIIGNILGVCVLVPIVLILFVCAISALENNYSNEYQVIIEERRLVWEQEKLERLAKKEQEKLERLAKEEQDRLEKIAKQEDEKKKKEQQLEKIAKQEEEKNQKEEIEKIIETKDKEENVTETAKADSVHKEEPVINTPITDKIGYINKMIKDSHKGELIDVDKRGIFLSWHLGEEMENIEGKFDINGDGFEESIMIGKGNSSGGLIEVTDRQGKNIPFGYMSYPQNAFNENAEIVQDYRIEIFVGDINEDEQVEMVIAIGDGQLDLGVSIVSYMEFGNEHIIEEIAYVEGQRKININEDSTLDINYGTQGVFDRYNIQDIMEGKRESINWIENEVIDESKDEFELIDNMLSGLTYSEKNPLMQYTAGILKSSRDYTLGKKQEDFSLTMQYIQESKIIINEARSYAIPVGYGLEGQWDELKNSLESLKWKMDRLLEYMADGDRKNIYEEGSRVAEEYNNMCVKATILRSSIASVKR